MLNDYLAHARLGQRVVATVYVKPLSMVRPDGPKALRPVGEIEFANGMAPERLRGVRQVATEHSDPGIMRFMTNPPPRGLLSHPGFRPPCASWRGAG